MKITLITGLPGSGKTFYSKTLSGFIIDDFSNIEGTVKDILSQAPKGDIIITDPWLIIGENRQSAELKIKEVYPDCKIEWIFFENNPKQCCKNLLDRNDGRKISYDSIFWMSKIYDVPENTNLMPVFNKEKNDTL